MTSQAKPRLIMLLGGARSGKSAYGETLAKQLAGEAPVLYIATASASDDEMRQRIARHQANRPPHWLTVEEPRNPASALHASAAPMALLDCVTLLVANLLLANMEDHDDPDETTLTSEFAEESVDRAIGDLLDAWRAHSSTLIVISNEVGMGIVPPYPLGRVYRDCLGRVNARLAAEADTVLLMIAGLPIELKALAGAWQREATRRFGAHG
ncbi:MAG TPA: bifunctional adenosylcobinamide kinase/adenosylcobinamide-phosphate guanylyltransferase [Ktedonobacterales bacterium]|jgi:adenosylcobinamide kinase / adenosylcobinamide-phosphate guanylyltransferase|nr:bifunctional adenosylcobinamide kinase/adenosylcobinamide-phosphate guanylyltransferase [Ktedonobacterales bacterium]